MSKRLRFPIFALVCLAALPVFCQYTPVSGALVQDGSGNLLGSGQICVLGVNPANNAPIPFGVGSSHGVALPAPSSCANVTTGVIASGFQVADSNLTHPQNVAYLVTITDNVSGASYTVGPTQISCTMSPMPSNCASGTWSLDGYYPSVVALALQQTGPTGPAGPTGATGATGAAGQGVPTGGTTGQVLTKNSSTNYDDSWVTPSGGGSSVTLQTNGTNNASQTALNLQSSTANTSGLSVVTSNSSAGNVKFEVTGSYTGPVAESQVTSLAADLAAKALDSAVVHNTGGETVAGVKTFSAAPAFSLGVNFSLTPHSSNPSADGQVYYQNQRSATGATYGKFAYYQAVAAGIGSTAPGDLGSSGVRHLLASEEVSGDGSMATNGVLTVVGINGVPLCAGFAPTNGQLVQYTTASSPNPCFGASTISSSGGTLTGANAPLGISGNNVTCPSSTDSVAGCLTAADHTTFSGKQAALGFTPENSANKNAASGYAGLDSGSKLSGSQLPNPAVSTLGGVNSKDCSGTGHLQKINTDGSVTCSADASGGATTNQNLRTIGAVFDGGGVALSATATRCTLVNYSGTIQGVTLASDVSGSATVDVRTVAYSSYTGPSSASSITASATPALSSAAKYQDTTLTGWTTPVAANTMVCFQLSSPSTVTWAAINVKVAAN